MPTRKQRRRREKELRHEWEEVYVDAEGRELPPEEVEELLPKQEPRKARATAAARGGKRGAAGSARGARGIQPPSWRRVIKRGAIFAPLMYLFIALSSRNSSTPETVLITVELLVIFLPFSYLMDSLMYRFWKKRQARAG
jgi:hypothetical protein